MVKCPIMPDLPPQEPGKDAFHRVPHCRLKNVTPWKASLPTRLRFKARGETLFEPGSSP